MALLGGRLGLIASNIKKGQTMADIGTDHGFLPLYLWENKICPKIVMTDISERSLSKAISAFSAHKGEAGVDFRLGDGLSPLEKGEADVAVIAGIGGILTARILGDDMPKTQSFEKFILQPRSAVDKLRYWLEMAGFHTVSEQLAEEGKFICEIITVRPPERANGFPVPLKACECEIGYEVPCVSTVGSNDLLCKFLTKKLIKERAILKEMRDGGAEDDAKKTMIEKRIEFLEKKAGEAAAQNENH